MARRSSLLARGLTMARPVMPDPLAPRSVVAFDFDGTLTVRDSFTAFLKWRAGPTRWNAGLVKMAPDLAAYVFHRNRGKLEADTRAFANYASATLFRPDALATWRRWQQRGAMMVVVTASPDVIVAPFARGLGCDQLIGSGIAYDHDDRVIGGLAGPNCRGPEKVRRLQAAFGEDIRLTAAYGDTSGDREMLQIADEKGYRVFKGRP